MLSPHYRRQPAEVAPPKRGIVTLNLTRLLTEGTGSWLHFEFACNRSGLFSEKYLTVPIGQILSAWGGSRVVAEYRHPILSPLAQGRGGRPEVDFVIFGEYPRIRYAVESKWIGRTTPSAESVLWDLIRLEMIAHSEKAECIFVLGGQRGALNAFFNSDKFYGARKPHQFRPLLRVNSNAIHSFPLVPTIPYRIDMLRSIFADYQSIAFPHKITTRRSAPFPPEGGLNQYQVYAWKVSSPECRDVFYPKNSKHYALSTSGERK
jgi:hypothetical protein